MVPQDVLDCLDSVLSALHRPARVDPTTMTNELSEVTAQFARRAELVVARINRHLSDVHHMAYVFFCEDEGYGAFALRDRGMTT
jgi:hypothetical protein